MTWYFEYFFTALIALEKYNFIINAARKLKKPSVMKERQLMEAEYRGSFGAEFCGNEDVIISPDPPSSVGYES